MIGFYNYTVILTYLSLLSGVGGIWLTIDGHPLGAMLCLLFCGLCDMFDGQVARTKKNRTAAEQKFGIQLDSLCDVVCFGVFPAVSVIHVCQNAWYAYAIGGLYVLAGVIRLAYFNVMEEERQSSGDRSHLIYSGLPITCAAMIFPVCFCFSGMAEQRPGIFRALLCLVTALTGFLFIAPIRVRKPRFRELMVILAVGLLVAAVITLVWIQRRWRIFG